MACTNTTAMYLGINSQICASGSASRSGSTVTVSGSFSINQGNSWNTNAIYACVSGRTGWVKVKNAGNVATGSANFSFSFQDNNAGSANFTAVFQVYNNAESGAVGGQGTVSFPVSWAAGYTNPSNPSVTLLESTNTSLSFRFGVSSWGGDSGRWEWWFNNSSTYSGQADDTYNYTPTSGYTWDAARNAVKSGLTSNREYWTHTRTYNQHYNNPNGVQSAKWFTRPQAPEVSLVDITVDGNILPFPYSSRPQKSNGITFTDNGDKSVTLNGTNDGNEASQFYLFSNVEAGDQTITLQPGTYHFAPPPDNKIGFTINHGSTYKGINGPNWSFVVEEPTEYRMMSITVAKGSTAVFDNTTFTPELLDDKGQRVEQGFTYTQWTGGGAKALDVSYILEEGDRQTPMGTNWTNVETIPAIANESRNGTKSIQNELVMGQTYTLFVKTSSNAVDSASDGSGTSPIKRLVFTTAFPPDPQLSAKWNDTRDKLEVTLIADDSATLAEAAWGYTPNMRNVIMGLDGKSTTVGYIEYPEHDNNQVIYLTSRVKSGNNFSEWTTPLQFPVNHPIIGLAIAPDGKKWNIVDIVEKKVSGKNLIRAVDGETKTSRGVSSYVVNNITDGLRIVASGTIIPDENDGRWADMTNAHLFTLNPGTYTVTTSGVSSDVRVTLRGSVDGARDDSFHLGEGVTSKTVTFTKPFTGRYIFISKSWQSTDMSVNLDFKIQLTRGDQPDATFEPYYDEIITPQWQTGKRIIKK